MSDPETTSESPWIGYGDALLRCWRFVVVGTLVAWTLVVGLHFLVPRTYECEATLSFPPVVTKVKDDEAQRPGIPLAFYRKLGKLISSEQILFKGMGNDLNPSELRSLLVNFGRHVVAVTTNPIGEVKRMSGEDTIIGIELAYEADSPQRATRVVTALAKLCRNAFLNMLIIEHVEYESAAATRRRAELLRKRAQVGSVERSLDLEARDMRRLLGEFPGIPPGSTQQVVDVREGGSRFLSPTMQMVGIRAFQVQTAHELRVLDGQVNMEATRLAFLRQLDQRIYGVRVVGDSELPGNVVEMVREELARFRATHGASTQSAELSDLGKEVEALTDVLGGAGETTRFVQLPTVRRIPRGRQTLGALALTTLLIVLYALARDTWTRAHSH